MAYSPVRVKTLIPNTEFPFDLFIRVNEKYLLYVHKGDVMDQKRVDKLYNIDEGVDRLFVTLESQVDYDKFITKKLDETIENPDISVDEKVDVVEGSAMTAMERMEEAPDSKANYKITEKAANSLRIVVSKNPDALKKIFGKKAKGSDEIMKHCFNVCAFACDFASTLGFSEQELDDLGAACLVHDLGLTKTEEDKLLFKKEPSKFTPDDKRIYKLHPQGTVDLMKDKPFVNDNVKRMILHHEEKLNGAGLRGIQKIEEIDQVFSLVNLYEKKVSTYGKNYFDAMKEVFEEEVGNYSIKFIKKFKEFIESRGLFDEDAA